MIDITRAQGNQSTTNGISGDWKVTLDGEELYKLPAHYSPQETFMIRDIIEKMMKLAVAESQEEAKLQCDVRIASMTSHSDVVQTELIAENLRLATILDTHLGEA